MNSVARIRFSFLFFRGILVLLALLACNLSHAANYSFPGSMPTGCSGSGGSYTCGALNLGYGDTITVASPLPATITINGALSTNTSSINSAGSASNLSLIVTGALTTGFQAVVNANVTAASVDVVGGATEVAFGGSLSTSSGNVVLGYMTTVAGSVNSSSGSIAVGNKAVVSGSVNSTSGTISVDYQGRVNGGVSTGGSVSLNNESVIGGSISGATGTVDVGYAAQVAGAITTSSGAITLAQNSVASACVMSTGSAAISLGLNASVNSVCCGAGCGTSCVINNSTKPMPPACAVPALTKTSIAASAVVGAVVPFTIVAGNSAAVPLNDVVVTDILPVGMTYVNHAATLGTVSVTGQVVTWSIPSVPAGGSAQLTLSVSLSKQGVLTNTVTSPGANAASASILVLASAATSFRMDEPAGSWTGATGEVIDSGGTALPGQRLTTTTPTTTNAVSPTKTIASQYSVVGSFCNAGQFDGKAVVEVADSPKFDYKTQLSASAWIYPTARPGSDYYSILSNDVNYEFHLSPSGKLYWWWQASNLTSATSIPLDEWTHVAITFNSAAGAGRQYIYINGVKDTNTASWVGTLSANACSFYIGGDISTGASCSLLPARNFRGMIDEVKLYDFELSADEVKADMTLGRSCSNSFDHIQIEHDGVASVCSPETVTVKACLDAACSTLYTGAVSVTLSPPGWVGGDTFTFSGGVATRELRKVTAGDVTLGSSSASPVPVNPTRCFKGASESCILNFGAASCKFDAVELAADPQTNIYTKLAGTKFSVDVLALRANASIDTTYKGTVAVDLVDPSSVACPTITGLNTAQSVKFVSTDKGRKSVDFTYTNAARNVKVRVKDGSSTPACSTDNFAIRPKQFSISSDMNNTGLTGTKKAVAGSAFTLTADGGVTSGFDGTPTLNPGLVNDHNGLAITSGTLSGSFAAGTGAVASGAGFKYLDVGNIQLTTDAVVDSGFTAVDQTSDCVAGTTSNTPSGGKFGCNIGSVSSTKFGRWYPSHYSFSGALVPGCAPGGYTYMNHDALGVTLSLKAHARALAGTAVSASDPVVSRYSFVSGYPNLAAVSLNGDNSGAAVATTRLASPAFPSMPNTTLWSAGIFTINDTFLFSRLAAPDGAFDQFKLMASLNDPDGSLLIGSKETNTSAIRYGRLRQQNAYGSELLALPVPLVAEYWSGTAFVRNVSDSCTVLTVPTSGSGLSLHLASGGSTTATLNSPLLAGDAAFRLAAPGASHPGYVDIRVDAPSYLEFNWTGAGDVDPTARATFGIYKSPLIYRRENY